MSRSVKLDTESLRAAQARAQQADRIGPDVEPGARDEAVPCTTPTTTRPTNPDCWMHGDRKDQE